VIRKCDERGRELRPEDPLERAMLQRDCLRHATRRNGVIDWEVYGLSYFGHLSMSDLFSESDSGDSNDSDCIQLQEMRSLLTFPLLWCVGKKFSA